MPHTPGIEHEEIPPKRNDVVAIFMTTEDGAKIVMVLWNYVMGP